MEPEEVTCNFCQKSFPKIGLQRYCSNCFGCTGCERYLCPVCDEVIEITPVRPMHFKNDSDLSKKPNE